MHPWEKNEYQWFIVFRLPQLDKEGKEEEEDKEEDSVRQSRKTQGVKNNTDKEERVGQERHRTSWGFFTLRQEHQRCSFLQSPFMDTVSSKI